MTEPEAEVEVLPSGWSRVWAVLRPRGTRGEVIVAALMLLLGLGLAVGVRTTRASPFAAARQEDLVRTLDELDATRQRLTDQVDQLKDTQAKLASGDTDAALAAARARADTLGVLAGVVATHGPGIDLTITAPSTDLTADLLVETVTELRNAGAEAIQVGAVRVVATTAFEDVAGGGVTSGGTALPSPLVVLAVGDARTMAAALRIPGGVVDAVSSVAGASADIETPADVVVSATAAS